jgi:hypothetical protein
MDLHLSTSRLDVITFRGTHWVVSASFIRKRERERDFHMYMVAPGFCSAPRE